MASEFRRWAPWTVLAVLVVVVLVVASTAGSEPSPDERAASLAARLACPVCEAQSVAESNAPISRQLREDIRGRIREGQSDEEILDAYVEQFGEEVLLRPKAEGVGHIVYALPLAAVLVGSVLLAWAVRRWSRVPRLVASTEDHALVAGARGTEQHPEHEDENEPGHAP